MPERNAPGRNWPRALLAFAVGVTALVGLTFWIGLKAGDTASHLHIHSLHAPVPSVIRRPPGGVPDPKIRFVDVARQAGVSYRWKIPGPRPLDILDTIGNGCAFLDYNNDGNLDILLVGPRLALYRGDGRGHFTDVTHQTGLDKLHGHFLGCAVGDYDNDGWDDLYITGYRTGLLLHNEQGKGFKDITRAAGLKPQPWGTSAAFGDVDGDGKLDLFVCDYLDFNPKTDLRLCPYGLNVQGACPPERYNALHGVLYHNLGRGRFRDVTAAWGVDKGFGKALGVAFADYDGSGRQGMAVANDGMPEDLFQHSGSKLIDVSRAAGTAFAAGRRYSGMGLDWADYDNDGRLDLTIGAFKDQRKCIYRNVGSGLFEEVSTPLGLTRNTENYIAFGLKWFDVDNDGWLDLIIANGHVMDNAAVSDPGYTYRQPAQLFRNLHGKRLQEIRQSAAGPGRPIVGRGVAVGDYDNDGRVDALVVDGEGAPLLLHNECRQVGHWLSLKLEGTRSNRDGIGAQVTVSAGGLTQTRLCHSDGSYLSASDLRVHIGLARSRSAQTVKVLWPSGHRDVFHGLEADRPYRLREGDPQPHALSRR